MNENSTTKPAGIAWWAFLTIAGLGVLGALVGAAIGDASYQPNADYLDFGRSFDVIVGAFIGGFVGVVAGIAVSVTRVVWRWAASPESKGRA